MMCCGKGSSSVGGHCACFFFQSVRENIFLIINMNWHIFGETSMLDIGRNYIILGVGGVVMKWSLKDGKNMCYDIPLSLPGSTNAMH